MITVPFGEGEREVRAPAGVNVTAAVSKTLPTYGDPAAAAREAILNPVGAPRLRELAAGDEGVLLGVEVGSFDQLLARIAGSPPVRRTDRAMERIVVRDALREAPRQRQALERLKERRRADHERAVARAECAVLDEIALVQHRRSAS